MVPCTQVTRPHPSDGHQRVAVWSPAPSHHVHTPLMAPRESQGGPWHPSARPRPRWVPTSAGLDPAEQRGPGNAGEREVPVGAAHTRGRLQPLGGSAEQGCAGAARHGVTWWDMARHGETQCDMVGHVVTRCDMAQHGVTRWDMVRHSATWCDMARRGGTRHDMV